MKIVFLGAGAWGTALAIGAARHPARHRVELWARDAAQAQAMQASRCNLRYLPGHAFPDALHVRTWPSGSLSVSGLAADADLIIVSTPTAALRTTLQALAGIPWSQSQCWRSGLTQSEYLRPLRSRLKFQHQ